MNEQRLIDLETKISFQEATIEELQKIVNDQYHSLEKIEKNLKLLTDKMTASEDSTLPKNEKPPHY